MLYAGVFLIFPNQTKPNQCMSCYTDRNSASALYPTLIFSKLLAGFNQISQTAVEGDGFSNDCDVVLVTLRLPTISPDNGDCVFCGSGEIVTDDQDDNDDVSP
jgi:hypothetical protein